MNTPNASLNGTRYQPENYMRSTANLQFLVWLLLLGLPILLLFLATTKEQNPQATARPVFHIASPNQH